MSKKIKEIISIERPREKLHKYGTSRLKDEELLGIIISSGIKGFSAIELGRRVIADCGPLSELTLEKILKIEGLGIAKGAQIISALELGRRVFTDDFSVCFDTPHKIAEACFDITNLKREQLLVLCLKVDKTLISRSIVSIGTLTESLVHPREVFEPAIKEGAASIVLVHNHPSGNPEPSIADFQVTQRIAKAGKLLGIPLEDHIVVAKRGFTSIAMEKGQLFE